MGMAQKVNLVKGKVLYDNETIGFLTEKHKRSTLYNLKHEPIVYIEVGAFMTDLRMYLQYFKLISPLNGKESYIKVPYKGSIQSTSKIILKEFTSTYPVLSASGINNGVISELLDADDRELRASIDKILAAETMLRKEISSFRNSEIIVLNEGGFGREERDVFVINGRVEHREEDDKLIYEIFDANDKQLAIWNEEGDNLLVFNSNNPEIYIPASLTSPFSSLTNDDMVKLLIVLTEKLLPKKFYY